MLASFLEIQQSCGHLTQPKEEYLTETQLLTKRGFRFHTALGHSDSVFHHCPGPSIYKPINPVLFTNGHLSGIDSHMAVILITQMVNAKKILLTLVFYDFGSHRFLPNVDSLGRSLKWVGICWQHVSSSQGDSACKCVGSERSHLGSNTWVGSYDHSLTSALLT